MVSFNDELNPIEKQQQISNPQRDTKCSRSAILNNGEVRVQQGIRTGQKSNMRLMNKEWAQNNQLLIKQTNQLFVLKRGMQLKSGNWAWVLVSNGLIDCLSILMYSSLLGM